MEIYMWVLYSPKDAAMNTGSSSLLFMISSEMALPGIEAFAQHVSIPRGRYNSGS